MSTDGYTEERLLNAGFQRGEAVAILSDNSAQFAAVVLACWRLGICVVPLDGRMPAGKLTAVLEELAITKVFVSGGGEGFGSGVKVFWMDEFADSAGAEWSGDRRVIDQIDLESRASITVTSGSSGVPKFVLHSIANHYYSALGSHENIPFAQCDRWLVALAMYHVSGFSLLMRAIVNGGTLVFPAAGINLKENIQQCDFTHISLVASQLLDLIESAECIERLRGLKAILLGGSAIPLSLIERAAALELPCYRSYGSTEMASQITTTNRDDFEVLSDTSGKILKFRELSISEEGEILVKGKTLFKGYVEGGELNLPVDDDGFFATCDMGHFDDRGDIHVTGRKDLMFVSGGENIYPEEIERAIESFGDVQLAVVVAVDNARFGKRPAAFVKTASGNVDADRIMGALGATLENFKVPDQIFPWPDFGDVSIKPDRKRFQGLARDLSSHK